MPESPAEQARETVRRARGEIRRLVEEGRRSLQGLSPRPIRRFIEERLRKRR